MSDGLSAVMAGWMMGYAMSVLTTIALTYICIQPTVLKVVQKYLDIPGMMLAIPFSIGSGFCWTLIGMLLGSFYELGAFDERAGALGAPSWHFLFIMATLAWIPVPIMFLFSRQLWWIWVGMALAFIGTFGWAMPLLAER